MESEKKNYPFYIVAIILLGIHTVWLMYYYRGMFYWRFILEQASYIVLILGMLLKKTNVLTVGAFSRVAIYLINTITAIQSLVKYGQVTFQTQTAFGFVINFLSCIAWALFAVSTIERKKAVPLCVAGAIVIFVGEVASGFGLKWMLMRTLMKGMDIAFIILCGILLQKGCLFTIKGKNAPKAIVRSSSPYEDILKLKELLDSGVITQEEFDEKKKQILGQ